MQLEATPESLQKLPETHFIFTSRFVKVTSSCFEKHAETWHQRKRCIMVASAEEQVVHRGTGILRTSDLRHVFNSCGVPAKPVASCELSLKPRIHQTLFSIAVHWGHTPTMVDKLSLRKPPLPLHLSSSILS